MWVSVLFCSSRRHVLDEQQAFEIKLIITCGNSIIWIRQKVSLHGQEKSIITLYSLTKKYISLSKFFLHLFTLDGKNNPKIVNNSLLGHTSVNYRNVKHLYWKPEDMHSLIPTFYEWLPRTDTFNSQGSITFT